MKRYAEETEPCNGKGVIPLWTYGMDLKYGLSIPEDGEQELALWGKRARDIRKRIDKPQERGTLEVALNGKTSTHQGVEGIR